MSTAAPRYAPLVRRLHWLMAVMIGLSYLLIEQRGLFARGTPGRNFMMQSHYWIGLAIFALVWLRLVQRRGLAAPGVTPALPAWQSALSKLLHVALYAFFIVMPLLGLATAWLDGKMLYLPFTQIMVPPLLAENEALAHTVEDLHKLVGNIFYWVIGLHIAAALYHHFVRRDDTLKRML